MPLLGSHLSVAGAFTNAVDEARRLECQTVQIFTKAPNQWRGRPIGDDEARAFRKAVRSAGLKRILGHDSYLINLASPDPELYRRSIEAFIEESLRAELLGLAYLVTHPGGHMEAGEEAGLTRVIAAIDEVHARTVGIKVKVLLETTAGQGTSLGHRFEHLKTILAGVREPRRLGVCVDTCHVFAAGYPLSPVKDYRRTIRELDRIVGLKWIKAFHLNDSLKPFGSRVDRHAHIGQGHLGGDAFGFVINDPRFCGLPMVLETPKEQSMDEVNLKLLRSLFKSR